MDACADRGAQVRLGHLDTIVGEDGVDSIDIRPFVVKERPIPLELLSECLLAHYVLTSCLQSFALLCLGLGLKSLFIDHAIEEDLSRLDSLFELCGASLEDECSLYDSDGLDDAKEAVLVIGDEDIADSILGGDRRIGVCERVRCLGELRGALMVDDFHGLIEHEIASVRGIWKRDGLRSLFRVRLVLCVDPSDRLDPCGLSTSCKEQTHRATGCEARENRLRGS